MKKLSILALGMLMVIAFSLPAAAFDSEFGGYWRTRVYSQSNFSGDDTETKDITQADTRSRLYYTAVFSDDFKFVNKFEWNSTWGDTVGGDIGADGTGILRIKNSYANFNLSSFNFLVGTQPRVLGRGFVFDDDFSGAVATYKGEGFEFPIIWIKAYEGGMGKDANDYDFDYYAVKPKFNVGDITLTPFAASLTSADASKWSNTSANEDVSILFVGLDLDWAFGAGSFWLTAINESGDIDLTSTAQASGFPESVSVSAMLLALGGSFDLGPADLHAKLLYATGDDDLTDDDSTAFFVPAGQAYYWGEIMGMGTFDNQSSAGSPAHNISNLTAVNVGVGYKVSDDLSISADVWNASLIEEDAAGETDLGTEIDLKLTYKLIENMKLDVIAAQLSSGKATGDENPVEFGTRLSFSF